MSNKPLKGHYGIPINIPACYDKFPDSFFLDSRDVMQIMGFASMTGVNRSVRSGLIPPPTSKRGRKVLWTLGDMRAAKEKRNEKYLALLDAQKKISIGARVASRKSEANKKIVRIESLIDANQ